MRVLIDEMDKDERKFRDSCALVALAALLRKDEDGEFEDEIEDFEDDETGLVYGRVFDIADKMVAERRKRDAGPKAQG